MGCSPHCSQTLKGRMSPRQITEMQTKTISPPTLKRVGIAAAGGFEWKEFLAGKLRAAGFEVTDFGDRQLKSDDDYPDAAIPLARAVAAGAVDRGVPAAMFPEHDLAPQIANRAYELFERRGSQSGHSDQDWLQAEQEIHLESIL